MNQKRQKAIDMSTTLRSELQKKLENELKRLQKITEMGYELEVRWIPNGSEKLSGEVKGDIIYIYEEDEGEAMSTLRHEFLDYAISQVIEPYKEVTNKLISLINEDAYKKKERFVESLNKIL